MQASPVISTRGRFLHLIPDDKFIDAARGVFEEALPGAHDYLLIGRPPLRYLRSFEPNYLELDRALESRFLATLSAYSAVFVHFLSDQARLIVASAPVTTRFIWLGWGADFYHLIYPCDELLLPKTRVLLTDPRMRENRASDVWTRTTRRFHLLAQPTKLVHLLSVKRKLSVIGRGATRELALINCFRAIATPIIEDYEAIQVRNPDFSVPFLDWNYWPEGFSACNRQTSRTGNDVLLGNSATPENNHLDALEMLSQCLPAERRIVCPLSYGNKVYGDAVERYGKALFGDRFVALREYMPSSSYMRIIEGCSIVVMNHIRQQALGNIVIALCSGARVFLNPKSPINRAMKRMGIDLATTDWLPDFLAGGEPKMSLSEHQAARHKIEEQYGRGSIVRRTRALLNALR